MVLPKWLTRARPAARVSWLEQLQPVERAQRGVLLLALARKLMALLARAPWERAWCVPLWQRLPWPAILP
jgi:hypothetical protein